MSKKEVFIVGLDQFNLDKLLRLPMAAECNFRAALEVADIRGVEEFDIQALVDKAIHNIESSGVKPDAICTYYDFPGSTISPILCEKYGLPGPSLQSVLVCEHKYWSRLEQQKVIPDHIPPFRVFDPHDDDAFEKIDLVPPYWIKPIKSFRSFLAYQINGPGPFNDAMKEVRKHIDYLGVPFNALMERHGMPPEFTAMKEQCIAESPLSGSQVTLEGYAYNGQMVGYGIVDSVRELDRSSFARYEYPSSLPLEVLHRMIDVSRQTIAQIGLDNTGFNIEFFYDQVHDQVYLLEINPRISQAHTDVFEKVHGASHLRVMLALALGRKPAPFERLGRYSTAANFMLRVYEQGRVTRVPTDEEIAKVLDEGIASHVKVHVTNGQELSDMRGQDSYSYELANIHIAARDQLELLDKYDRALEILNFEVQRAPERIVQRRRYPIEWNGTDVPSKMRNLAPGRYVLEPV